ncbi:MAG TPA: hypothetical protein DCM08_13335 [Microscillaceae bacterium]|nr:hypothetical protein [Microscillaceae bacterium]
MKQQELLEKVAGLSKLSTDLTFRNELIANPKKVLKQEFSDLQIADELNIVVHENTDREMHIILIPDEQMVFNASLDEKVEAVLDKAVADTQFKKLVMADPKGTLSKELPDFYIPNDFKIHFYENSTNEVHLLLPPLQTENGELSETELQSVAGGRGRGPHIGRPRGGGAPKCRSQHFRTR